MFCRFTFKHYTLYWSLFLTCCLLGWKELERFQQNLADNGVRTGVLLQEPLGSFRLNWQIEVGAALPFCQMEETELTVAEDSKELGVRYCVVYTIIQHSCEIAIDICKELHCAVVFSYRSNYMFLDMHKWSYFFAWISIIFHHCGLLYFKIISHAAPYSLGWIVNICSHAL